MAPVNPGSQPNRAPTNTHGIKFLTSSHGHGNSQVPGSQWARTTHTSVIFLHWPTPTVQDILIGLRHPINDHKPVSRGHLLTPDAGGPQCLVDCYSRLLMYPNTKSSLVAQMVKHLPTMRETRVQSLFLKLTHRMRSLVHKMCLKSRWALFINLLVCPLSKKSSSFS